MELTVKQRLVRYLAEKGIGQNKFERLAGISNGYIYNLKSTPKEGQLTKILQAAPDLNRVWLLTGEGEMLNTDVAPVQAAEAVEEVTVNSHGNKCSLRRSKKKGILLAGRVPFYLLLVTLRVAANVPPHYSTVARLMRFDSTALYIDIACSCKCMSYCSSSAKVPKMGFSEMNAPNFSIFSLSSFCSLTIRSTCGAIIF